MVATGSTFNERILGQVEERISFLVTNQTEVDPTKEKDEDTPRNQWKMCRIIEAQPDQDGLVRKVMLDIGNPNLTPDGRRQALSTLERPIHKLVLLMSEDQ